MPRATDSGAEAPSGATSAAHAAAATAAGARTRMAVSETVLGTSAAISPIAQNAQSPMVATSCTERLRGSSASPNEGPATKGRTSQTIAVAHRPKCCVAVVIGAEICPRTPRVAIPVTSDTPGGAASRTGPRRSRRGTRAAGARSSDAARAAVELRRSPAVVRPDDCSQRPPLVCRSGSPPASATCPTATRATPSSSSSATTLACLPRRRCRLGPGARAWSPRRPPASRASRSTTTAPSTSTSPASTPRRRSAILTSPVTPTAACGPSSPRWPTGTGRSRSPSPVR